MGFEKGQGNYVPQTESDQKMWLSNRISFEGRNALFVGLGYTAFAGISNNKTVAKIACTYNKPNGQTVVPECYKRQALADVPIRNIRWLGGKLGKQLIEAGLQTMGDIQPLDVENELVPIIGCEKARWVKEISLGICGEEVNEKQGPKSSGAIKTFKPINSLEKILK